MSRTPRRGGVLGVIPARYQAARFPGKPLALIAGRPMIQHVYEAARRARRLDAVVVATDDARIAEAVRGFGGEAVMTSAGCRSGTDRVAEVARRRRAAIVLNIQGDEPLLHPAMIDQVAGVLLQDASVVMASLRRRLADPAELASPHVVKVVVDRRDRALYFSRAAIPFMKSTIEGRGARGEGRGNCDPRPPSPAPCPSVPPVCWKHLGIYGFRRDFLLRFARLAPTPLEQCEGLEQLRALECGYAIVVPETMHDSIGVDTLEDLRRVEEFIRREGGGARGTGRGARERRNSPAPCLPPPAPRGR